MQAKAMVVPTPGRLEMREFDVAKPAADQVLVRTTVTSVCASDVKVLKGLTPLGRYPLIMGHEVAGNVGDAMKLIACGRYPFEKINNRTYRLEDLAEAIAHTEARPEGFIKGAVMF